MWKKRTDEKHTKEMRKTCRKNEFTFCCCSCWYFFIKARRILFGRDPLCVCVQCAHATLEIITKWIAESIWTQDNRKIIRAKIVRAKR